MRAGLTAVPPPYRAARRRRPVLQDPEPVLGQGQGQLLLSRESLPRRLSSHPQGRPDGRPRGAKHSRPVHEAGEIVFDLRAGGSHPREARQNSVEVKVLFPRRQPCWQRRWTADDLAAQIDTFVADVDPWTSAGEIATI